MKETPYTREESGDIPRDVAHVNVHPSVKAIKNGAFSSFRGLTNKFISKCSQLMTVNLGEELVDISKVAYQYCPSLSLVTSQPPPIKAINNRTFKGCEELTTTIPDKGLELIGNAAFFECKLLEEIVIPPAVKAITAYPLWSHL